MGSTLTCIFVTPKNPLQGLIVSHKILCLVLCFFNKTLDTKLVANPYHKIVYTRNFQDFLLHDISNPVLVFPVLFMKSTKLVSARIC